jgi:CubicO group peptidase (beta-lactamase class C family)
VRSPVETAASGLHHSGELQRLLTQAALAVGTAGAQVSVIVDGERLDLLHGTANAELGIPMMADTVTQLGSTTKLFNAVIVMSLVDEGRLTLDAPISRYLPDLVLGGMRAPDAITLRRLLSMGAGIDFGPYLDLRGDDAIGRYVAALSDIPLTHQPGQGFGYSNASVCIAAHAAERVTGMPWDTLLKRRVLEPAGLTQAANAPTDLPFVRVAVGHTTVQGGHTPQVLRPWDDAHCMNPSGSGRSLAMSAHDLASFGQIFLNGGQAMNGNRVLSESAVKDMMTATTAVRVSSPHWGVGSSWGVGPTVATWGETEVWGHGGSARGGGSMVLWFPEKRASVAFTVNSPITFEAFAVRITGDFTARLVGARAPTQPKPPANPLQVDDPLRYIGTYLRAGDRIEIELRDGRLRYREYNEGLSARFKEMGETVAGGRGEVKPLVDQELIPLGDDRFLVSFPGFANGISVFFFGNDDGRATNLNSGLRTSRRSG